MGKFKDLDIILNEVADKLAISDEMVHLSQVCGGWLADVYTNGFDIKGNVCKTPDAAMKSLLKKSKNYHTN